MNRCNRPDGEFEKHDYQLSINVKCYHLQDLIVLVAIVLKHGINVDDGYFSSDVTLLRSDDAVKGGCAC